MVKILCALLFLFCSVLGDDKNPIEIYFRIIQGTSGDEFCVEATSLSHVWNSRYNLTDIFDYGISQVILDGPTGECGFEFTGKSPYYTEDTLGYGLYKINFYKKGTYTDNFQFYLDLRDNDWVYVLPWGFDIVFIYNFKEKTMSYDPGQSAITGEIIEDDTVLVWEMKNREEPGIDKFQPTIPSNLHYENSNGRPCLIWNLSEPREAATYEVWRKVCSNPPKYNVIVEDWCCIQSLPTGSNSWTDQDFQISGTLNRATYKVRAVSGNGLLYSPNFSNNVSVTGTFLPFDKKQIGHIKTINMASELSVFPNPFNRSLRINLYSPTEQINDIMIYDLQGRIVKEFLPAPGNYYFDTIWNGRDNQDQPLQSGIYFLIACNGSKTLFRQKIIYLK